MKQCQHNGKIYQVNEYGLTVSVQGTPTNDMSQCEGGLYVRPSGNYSYIFVGEDDKLYKCARNESEDEMYKIIGKHHNFLQYYGRTEEGCTILEYLPNAVTLYSLMGTQPVQFLDMVNQAFEALDYIHSLGYGHDDLHANNILWDYDKNRIVIIDLDLRQMRRSSDVEEEVYLSNILWRLLLHSGKPHIFFEDEVIYARNVIHEIESNRETFDGQTRFGRKKTRQGIDTILNRLNAFQSNFTHEITYDIAVELLKFNLIKYNFVNDISGRGSWIRFYPPEILYDWYIPSIPVTVLPYIIEGRILEANVSINPLTSEINPLKMT